MRHKVTLKILSPLHIGEMESEKKGMNFTQDNNYVRIVDEATLAQRIPPNKYDDLLEYIGQNDGRGSLDRFAREYNITSLANAASRTIEKDEIQSINSFRSAIWEPFKDAQRNERLPYIPGSSIKGALRGAFLSSLAERPDYREALRRILTNTPDPQNARQPGASLDDFLRPEEHDPKGDLLRFLHVGDFFPKPSHRGARSKIYRVRILSMNNDGNGCHESQGNYGITNIFLEALCPGLTFEGNVDIDEKGFSLFCQRLKQECLEPSFPIDDLDKWLQWAQEHTQKLLKAELAFFKQIGNEANAHPNVAAVQEQLKNLHESRNGPSGPNLRLGWGAGLLSNSQALGLTDAERLQLRDTFGGGNHFREVRTAPYFPQSRKVIYRNNEPAETLGWVRLEVLKEKGL